MFPVCFPYGLKRDTVLLLESYLIRYCPGIQDPEGGIASLAEGKRRGIRLAAFEEEMFCQKAGREFQDRVLSVFHPPERTAWERTAEKTGVDRKENRHPDRTLDMNQREDVAAYMNVYMSFAYAEEEMLAGLYHKRKYSRIKLGIAGILTLLFCFFAILFESVNEQDGAARQAKYLRTIQSQQEGKTQTKQRQEKAQADMDRVIAFWEE